MSQKVFETKHDFKHNQEEWVTSGEKYGALIVAKDCFATMTQCTIFFSTGNTHSKKTSRFGSFILLYIGKILLSKSFT